VVLFLEDRDSRLLMKRVREKKLLGLLLPDGLSDDLVIRLLATLQSQSNR
jgi:hypothetical protein